MKTKLLGIFVLAIVASACRGDSSSPNRVRDPNARRNIDELQRIMRDPRGCDLDVDCPIGSHCGEDETCTWSCLADSECGTGRRCDHNGSCVAGGFSIFMANDSDACQALPASERRAAQIALYDDAQQGNFITCFDDESCPCGSFCSVDAICQVECIADTPPPELTCGSGLACTPLGRCADAPDDPGPPLTLSIALSEPVTTRNTAVAPALVPLTITVSATSLAVVSSTSPAIVKLSIAEVRAFEQGRTAEAPTIAPRVRCASDAALASSCEIAGGWTFDVVSGQLRSAPKPIWIEIPQTTTAMQWTLEARSEWAADPAIDIVKADPLIVPATDPGHYRGTLALPNPGSDGVLSLPIEAIVTSTHIAVIEPTRLVLPDGHAVISRDATNATVVGWLTSGGSRYDVVLGAPQFAYDPTTGKLDVGLDLASVRGAAPAPIDLVLERTGDAPACPCSTGSYCNATIARCLPGSGPPSGGIVSAALALPSDALPSATLAAWATPLATVVANNSSLLSGTSLAGIERAYCFQSTSQPGPARFGVSATQDPTAQDLLCMQGGTQPTEYNQTTFAFANRDREYVPESSTGPAFDLFETCLADLAATPSGSATAANLLAPKSCVSLGRVFTALSANAPNGVGQPLPDLGVRLVSQLLRQWLGVNAYVASTATQARRYDDALAISSAAAHERLGTIVDRVEDGLRVLLDRSVRPQFATGAALTTAMSHPDYRIPLRPVTRWTFNDRVSPSADAEGTTPFTATNVDLTTSDLNAHNQSGAETCTTTSSIMIDDRRFTISANLRYTPVPGSTTVVFEKLGPGGDRLWIEATAGSTTGFMNLALKDSRGGVATFTNIESGMIAIAADNGTYRALRGATDGTGRQINATSVLNSGPRWGAAGTIRLACDLPVIQNSCTSWDRNVVGDQLDVVIRSPYTLSSSTYRYTCQEKKYSPYTTSCTGTAPSSTICNNGAATKRQEIINGLFPNAPSWAVSNLKVTGSVYVFDEGNEETTKFSTTWTDWRCTYSVTNHPVPVTGVKPVCPTTPQAIRWDEVALWNRPLMVEEIGPMAARYGELKTNQILPPATTLPGEQAAALPVHLVEAASAHLDLLAEYIAAERAVMYEECYLGGTSPARDRVAARAGRNVRLVAILDAEAERLAALAPTAPWSVRYQAARRALAGRRARAVEQMQLAAQCENPLGITENDLPLYVGEEVGASAKFFASSRFLATKAKEEIALAQNRLSSAQSKYLEQRRSAYQTNQAREDKLVRMAKLRAEYESALTRYCGKPAGTQKLLDGFLAGTLTTRNCFIKTEIPGCSNVANTPLESAPATCLRGDIGARLLGIQAARIDMENASRNHTRAMDQFDAESANCARRQAELEEDQVILEKHNRHMKSLRETRGLWGKMTGVVTMMAKTATGDVAGAFQGMASFAEADIAQSEGNAQAAFQEVMSARSHAAEIAECFHRADMQKFTIDSTKDVIKRANQDVVNAQFQLENDRNAIGGLLDAAAGQLALEDQLTSTPPHHHFWLDAEITEYHRHLEYGRRLTYLALRAVEYESQQAIGHRGATLSARRPDALLAVVTAIEQRNAPMQGEIGLVIGERPVVLSLRDEILRMLDIASATAPLPGEPPLTPEQAFKRYLASDSSKILDANGRYIGRGIRFALRPAAWSETSCAERIWRLTPSLQIDNPPTQHGMVLFQSNAFGSQDCRAPFGTVTMARAQPSVNLLTGDTSAFASPSSFTAVNIDGPLGNDHETLRARDEGDIAGLAGRGLYSNYVLLFPPQTWPDAEVAKIKDVLLRFDIVEVTRPSPL